MQCPKEYSVEYVVMHDVPYRNTDPAAKGTHASEGVFHEGRVLWLKETITPEQSDSDVTAYVEGAGLVALNSRSLKPCNK